MVLAAIAAAVVTAIVGGAYWYTQVRGTGQIKVPVSEEKLIAGKTYDQVKNEAATKNPDSTIAADVATTEAKKSIENKDYTKAIAEAKTAYENKNASTPARVNAFAQCIIAAKAAGDTATVNDCKTKAEQVIAGIPAGSPPDLKEFCDFLIKNALGEAKDSDYGGIDANH